MGDRLRFWVNLVFDKILLGFSDFGAGKSRVAPSLDFNALAFEILVDGEEVGDLPEHVGVDLGEVPDILVAWISFTYAENFLIAEPLVQHLKDTDGTDLHDTPRKAGCVDQDKTVDRIAIVSKSTGDKPVVARVMNGGVEVAVETEDIQFLVVLVFVAAFVGNLDHSVDDLGALGPYGEFQVIRHKSGFSSLM